MYLLACLSSSDLGAGVRSLRISDVALTYSERISRRYCGSDRERSMRAKTEAFEREALREAIRATSEIRRDLTPAPRSEEERQASRYIDEAHRRADQVITRHRSQVRDIAEDTNRTVSDIKSHTRRYEDNISKKMADIRMSPWRGEELDAEYSSSQEARARITGLERQLRDITTSSMAYRPYHKSARELASEARRDDEMSTSHSTRRVVTSVSDHKTRRFLY
jgi:polyhydroxyalkanoate synthesis regulator phasin